MDLIKKYFPDLSAKQVDQYTAMYDLYLDWNQKINVISRKDIQNLYEHHILHSLTLAKYINLKPGAKILDLGTGGGFPGVPLAVFFPEVSFHLVDSIRKKLTVISEVCNAIGVNNVTTQHSRVEDLKKVKYDFVVTRAVATADKLHRWSSKHVSDKHIHSIPNGIIALKGGNIKSEAKSLPRGAYYELTPISDYFEEPYFEEKYVLYIQG